MMPPPTFAACAEVLSRRADDAVRRASPVGRLPPGVTPLAIVVGARGPGLLCRTLGGVGLQILHGRRPDLPTDVTWRFYLPWSKSPVLEVLPLLRKCLDAADGLPVDGVPPGWTPFAVVDQIPGRHPPAPGVIVRRGNRFLSWDGEGVARLPEAWRWRCFFRPWRAVDVATPGPNTADDNSPARPPCADG